jgi:hypothetical protein
MSRRLFLLRNLAVVLLVTIAVSPAFASGPYKLGSSNTVTADPNIPRPFTTPCVVTLFTDAEFDNFNPYSFSYTPPSECPGPWAKVVFEADINVTAGIQYDRTANFWLGPTNIYFGTTAEPSPSLGPSWHVESDLTDYSPIFTIAQEGTADIGNLVNSTYTGIIYATASLEFYPLAFGQSAPVTANQVYALAAGPTGGTVALNNTSSTLSGTFTLPTNVVNAYLDVYAQSQSDDEFWYTCVPNDVATELQSCGDTGFRETEITIDGQPAGVAPVFPWIFTGGIDPYLWFPIPGIQTLNFVPYRVNLTPFAGMLSNGQPHTVSLSVYNADSYFSATASLLVYQDPNSSSVTGAVTQNTLSSPNPVITENLHVQPTYIKGTVNVGSERSFTITGYANTSKGKVTTSVAQNVNFFNDQYFDITDTTYTQDITLGSSVTSTTTTSSWAGKKVESQTFNFPATLNFYDFPAPNGDSDMTTTVEQNYTSTVITTWDGFPIYASNEVNMGRHQDTIDFNTGLNSNQSSSQYYSYWDSNWAAYQCDLQAEANVLTYFSKGCAQ